MGRSGGSRYIGWIKVERQREKKKKVKSMVKVSYSVGTLSPVNHKGLYQGW